MRILADGRGLAKVSPITAGIINGTIDVSEWSDEELIRGQRKNKRGKWDGKPPGLVPAAIHQEITRRRFSRAFDLLADSLVDCALMLRSIVNDKRAAKSDRIKAAEVLMDRVLGRPKEQVSLDLTAEASPWQSLIAAAIVGTEEQARTQADSEVVEGEVLDDEDELLDDTLDPE